MTWGCRLLVVFVALSGYLVSAQIVAQSRVPACRASQLSADEDRNESDEVEGGLGNHAMTIAIQNRSSSPCVLEGVPAIMFLSKADQQLPVPVCSNCNLAVLWRPQPVGKILLASRGFAYLLVGFNINDGARGEIPCRTAIAVRLRLPDRRGSLRFSFRNSEGFWSCGPVYITPVLAKPPADGVLPTVDAPDGDGQR